MKASKRLMAVLLSIATIVCMMPAMAFATEEAVEETTPVVTEEAPAAEVVEEDLEAKGGRTPKAADLTYNGEYQCLIKDAKGAKFFKYEDDVYPVAKVAEITAKNAGSYEVKYSYKESYERGHMDWETLDVTIQKAEVTATWTLEDKEIKSTQKHLTSVVYDGEAHEAVATIVGLFGDDAENVLITYCTYEDDQGHHTTAVDANKYTTYAFLTLEGAKEKRWDWSDNYDFKFDGYKQYRGKGYKADWKIAQKDVYVEWGTLTYNGVNQNSDDNHEAWSVVTLTGLVGADQDAWKVIDLLDEDGDDLRVKHAGTYTANAIFDLHKIANLDNYDFHGLKVRTKDSQPIKEVLEKGKEVSESTKGKNSIARGTFTVLERELTLKVVDPEYTGEAVLPTVTLENVAEPDEEDVYISKVFAVDSEGDKIEAIDARTYAARAYVKGSHSYDRDYVFPENLKKDSQGRYYYEITFSVAYKALEGVNATYAVGNENGLTFKSNGAFDKFVGLYVDGNPVDSKYYTVKKGSTVVTLSKDYLNTLKNGAHTLTMAYSDGQTVDFAFNVTGINTGDSNDVLPYALLLMISVLGCAGYGLKKRQH